MHTELRLPRRRRGQNSAQTSKAITDTVRVLTRICPDEVIAGVLNRNGLLTGRGNRWTQERVTSRRSHHAIPCYDAVLAALEATPSVTEKFSFWSGNGKLESIVRSWQTRLRRLFKLANVQDGHAHRFRDTFAVELLLAGVPIERVSILSGHQS